MQEKDPRDGGRDRFGVPLWQSLLHATHDPRVHVWLLQRLADVADRGTRAAPASTHARQRPATGVTRSALSPSYLTPIPNNMALSDWLTPTTRVVIGSGAIIIVLVYIINKQRRDARNGRRIRKHVAKILGEMGCKIKGGRITCTEGGGLKGLGESFKLDKAVDRSIDQFCDLLRESNAPQTQHVRWRAPLHNPMASRPAPVATQQQQQPPPRRRQRTGDAG